MSRMHCKAVTSAFFAISCFFASTSLAETSLHVRLGDSIRPVNPCSNGVFVWVDGNLSCRYSQGRGTFETERFFGSCP